jgi:hypothetical protein
MVAPEESNSVYHHSIFYQTVLRSLSPRWYMLQKLSFAGIFASLVVLPWIIGISIWVGLSLLLFVSLAIIAHRKLAQSIPLALTITEKLSKEWFNRRYAEQELREQKREIQRLKSIYLDMLHPPRGGNPSSGGTMYGARGEDL